MDKWTCIADNFFSSHFERFAFYVDIAARYLDRFPLISTLRLGAQSSYVVKYFEGSNAVKTTSMS